MREGLKYRLEKLRKSTQDSTVLQDLHSLRQLEAPKVIMRGEELCSFAWEDWNEIRKAFENHADLPLHQWWKNVEDVHFESGSVRIGWREDKIYLLASMEDQSVVTTAQRNGERLWELGDVVEIFIKSLDASEYYELQVAPNGCTLQLRYPDASAITTLRGLKMKGWDRFIVHESIFSIRSRVDDKKWHVLVEIPGELLFFDHASLLGCSCRISVSRYDYWEDARSPHLSSTSPHSEMDFHRQKDWAVVELVKPRPSIT